MMDKSPVKQMVVAPSGLSKDPRLIRKAPQMQDVYTGNLQVLQTSPIPPRHESFDRSFLDRRVELAETSLREELEQDLLSTTQLSGTASGVRQGPAPVQMVMTPRGTRRVVKQVSVDRVMDRTPEGELVSKYVKAVEMDRTGKAHKFEVDLTNLYIYICFTATLLLTCVILQRCFSAECRASTFTRIGRS